MATDKSLDNQYMELLIEARKLRLGEKELIEKELRKTIDSLYDLGLAPYSGYYEDLLKKEDT